VLSASLRDNGGSPIGRIEDLLVDPGSGRIEFVLAAPFFPTNNSKIMPIPWKALKQGSDGLSTSFGGNQVFMVNVPRSKLEQAPAFERFRWTHSNDDTWRQKVLRFYIDDGQTAAGSTGSGSKKMSGAGSSDEGAGSVTNTPVYSNDFIGPRLNSGSPNTRDVQRPVDSSRSDTPLPIGARR